ncbi:hypothetical protein [Desulfovibrio sp. UCD-KL4C]|uniref:hypothetical protein n=1 Tax=Desulfovibrio sp. UCD-KL4C TaxID=2578120 RepID=UPI0025C5E4F5|nr:hypothetical protein [Desulfovibrio sp. UCD-KL4C]
MSELDLSKLAEELRTQKNLGTKHPIFVVRERIKIYGLEPEYTEDYDWFDPSEPDCIISTVDLEDENGNPMTEEQAEEKGFIKFYYTINERFKNAHFTRKAAELYISENGHNLTDPYVFVDSMHYCHEMIAIREHLMDLAPQRIGVDFNGVRYNISEAAEKLFSEIQEEIERGGNTHEVKEAFDDLSQAIGVLFCLSMPSIKHFDDLSDEIEDMPRFLNLDEEEEDDDK